MLVAVGDERGDLVVKAPGVDAGRVVVAALVDVGRASASLVLAMMLCTTMVRQVVADPIL